MSNDQPSPRPKFTFTEWATNTPTVISVSLVLLITVGMIWLVGSSSKSSNLGVEQARSMLAVMFSVATIVLAFSMILGAFLSADPEAKLKDRHGLAFQVLTPLIGIMGTILGFYFGTVEQPASQAPLAILDVVGPGPAATAGETVQLTVLLHGGRGPWRYELNFGPALPVVKRSSNVSYLRESVVIPADLVKDKPGTLGLTVTVTDANDGTVTWERKAGEWLTIQPRVTTSSSAPPPPPQP